MGSHKMSHHGSEDNFVTGGSDSFWEPGNYKRTTKRIEDGNKLCTDLMTLVSERADIEKAYARQLKQWAAKWNNIIEKGPEYGTMKAAWKAVLVESDRRCDLHNRGKEDLLLKVNSQLKTWQRENYHKQLLQLKEKKEMDEQFKKAQKPWSKLLVKVNKAKSDYQAACKAEKTAVNIERNAGGDSSLSQDHLKKLQDRVSKAKDAVSKSKDTYESALQDLNNYNAKYMEDMTDVFERCQRMEAQGLQSFKESLFMVQKCLNISEDPALPQIYEEFYHTVNNADHEKDLRLWSNTHGVNMAMNWPQFEEYLSTGSNAVKKTSRDHRNGKSGTLAASTGTTNGTGLTRTANNAEYRSTISNGGLPSSTAPTDRSPFDEEGEEWDENPDGVDQIDPLIDTGEPGVKVRALYDYEAAESDELDFKAGDLFEKLEDEDEQGWCKGRKDGKVGLYPANYIEVI